jgi:hypothetical protein
VTTQIQLTRSRPRPGRARVVGSVVACGLPLGGAAFLFLGELALHGALCLTAGMLPMVMVARPAGLRRLGWTDGGGPGDPPALPRPHEVRAVHVLRVRVVRLGAVAVDDDRLDPRQPEPYRPGPGGLEADPVTIARVVEILSGFDSAVGWAMIAANDVAWWVARLPDAGAEEIYAEGPSFFMATAFHPPVKPTEVEGMSWLHR